MNSYASHWSKGRGRIRTLRGSGRCRKEMQKIFWTMWVLGTGARGVGGEDGVTSNVLGGGVWEAGERVIGRYS